MQKIEIDRNLWEMIKEYFSRLDSRDYTDEEQYIVTGIIERLNVEKEDEYNG